MPGEPVDLLGAALVRNGGISVIVPTRDDEAVIRDCLRSLFRQSRAVEEILVVDRRSRDSTHEILEEDFPNVQVVKTRRRTNLAQALNLGIRLTSNPLVSIVFPAAKLEGKYFESVIENLEKPENADVGSATGKIYKMFRGSNVIDSSGLIAGKGVSPPLKRGEGENGLEAFGESDTVLGVARAAAVYRRALLEDVSHFGETFDESLTVVLEDVDLAWRAHLQGWRALYVPEAVATFDVRDEGPGPTFPNASHWEHDWRVVVLKNAPARALVRGWVQALLGGAEYAVKDTIRVLTSLSALASVSSGWTELRCKRQEIQRRAAERAMDARRRKSVSKTK
jgi:GT2 family glycosyltransferase